MAERLLGKLVLLGCLTGNLSAAQKFFPDDPIREDRDDLPIMKPAPVELSPTYDLLENSFASPAPGPGPMAVNVNTLGEVPDSSWFTNRVGIRDMPLEEILRGPYDVGPPDTSRITVVAAKQGGITPGFTIRDGRGQTYFVKFDPRRHPNLSTAADVISTHFFHAMGYNVPENYIVYLRSAKDLEIEAGAEISLPGGKKVPMDRQFLEFMLANAAHHPDGSTRAVASALIPGDILGPFKFYGTRPDDPNDIFPHQDRRELRGYRVFCSWLNHDDSRSINTIDTFVATEDDGTGHVRHYLIDFGSTLGAGSDPMRRIAPQDPRAGYEYLVEIGPTLKTAYSLGLWERPWMRAKYPYPRYAEIGRIEADFFGPQAWKPEYPNPAFERLRLDDAFWAAKIVARFSDDAIRAIVHKGEYLDPEAERYLADVIIRRRDKVVEHYFRQLNPLDGFRVLGDQLEFRNLGAEKGIAVPEGYRYTWFRFDSVSDALTEFVPETRTTQPAIALPADRSGEYLMVRIRTYSGEAPEWAKAVDVYLRTTSGLTVVGIEREI